MSEFNSNSETMANRILPESQRDILNQKLDEAKSMPEMKSVSVQVDVRMMPKAAQTDEIQNEDFCRVKVISDLVIFIVFILSFPASMHKTEENEEKTKHNEQSFRHISFNTKHTR